MHQGTAKAAQTAFASSKPTKRLSDIKARNSVGLRHRRYQRVIWTGLTAALLSACTTDRALPEPQRSSSIIEYLQTLRHETSTLLDSVATQRTSPTQDEGDYRHWADHWCPRHADVHSTDDVVRKVSDVCRLCGGVFVEPFCEAPATPDHVLFYASFRRGIDLCQGVAATVSVEVVEPTIDHISSPGYLAKLRALGYRTQEDRHAEQAAHVSAQQQERDRAARELPLLRTRGTQVCRTQGGVTFLGYVEDTSGPKIQISIHEARMGLAADGHSLGPSNPNYRPETVWDAPEHWFVCEAP